MSVNAIRGVVLVANVLLLGLISWFVHDTFVVANMKRYLVVPPDTERYRVQAEPIDEHQRQHDLYAAISRVFDRPAPPRLVPTATPGVIDSDGPDRIQVLVVNVPITSEGVGSALLKAPLASPNEPKFVQVGMDLGELPEFRAHYKNVRLKSVSEKGVILLDAKGNDVHVAGPRGDPEGT